MFSDDWHADVATHHWQAQATQEANRAATNRWPPFWAIAAMVFLGFNEFVAVLYNPLWLLLALFLFLFGKTVYQVILQIHSLDLPFVCCAC